MAKRMRDRGASAVLVTTPDGRLVGLLYREDGEQAVGLGASERAWVSENVPSGTVR